MTAGSGRQGRRDPARSTGPGRREPDRRVRPAVTAALSLVGWTSLLLVGVALLHGVGGSLSPPPLADPAGWQTWADHRQPVEAAFAVVRLLTLALAWYLLAATVVGAAARLTGVTSVVRAADAVTVLMVRRLVNGALGVSLAAVVLNGGGTALAEGRAGPPGATVGTVQPLPDAPPDSPVPVMERLPGPTGETVTSLPGVEGASGSADAGPPPDPPTGQVDDGSGAPTSGPAPIGRTWPVQPGEHFWAVAEKVLAETWSRAPADREVDSYWRELIDVNRALLRDPANPDLLFPGQVIAVPPPPGTPAPTPPV